MLFYQESFVKLQVREKEWSKEEKPYNRRRRGTARCFSVASCYLQRSGRLGSTGAVKKHYDVKMCVKHELSLKLLSLTPCHNHSHVPINYHYIARWPRVTSQGTFPSLSLSSISSTGFTRWQKYHGIFR